MSNEHRIIAHIDLDCFYVQVERSLNPSFLNKPVAVVQYNPFGDLKTLKGTDNRCLETNGSIIAVSYEARSFGVKRGMRGNDARKLCSDLIVIQVPVNHGKADLSIYRNASNDIVNVLLDKFSTVVIEKASIDEVYLDLTKEIISQTNLFSFQEILQDVQLNLDDSLKLAGDDRNELNLQKKDLSKGHSNCESNNENIDIELKHWLFRINNIQSWSMEYQLYIYCIKYLQFIRKTIFQELGFTVSGGISHNKLLAKIGSGMHKPNKLTIFPAIKVLSVFTQMPLTRIPGNNNNHTSFILLKLRMNSL